MVASLLTGQPRFREFAELLRPEPLPDGTDPEERLIICGLSWQRYLDIDKALGDDRPGPLKLETPRLLKALMARLYFCPTVSARNSSAVPVQQGKENRTHGEPS